MGAADYIELLKWVANAVAIPAVGFIWQTQARITRVETKLDMLMQFHGVKGPATTTEKE